MFSSLVFWDTIQPRFVCSLPSSHLSLLSTVASQAVHGAVQCSGNARNSLASHSRVWAEQYSAIRVDLQTNTENGLRVWKQNREHRRVLGCNWWKLPTKPLHSPWLAYLKAVGVLYHPGQGESVRGKYDEPSRQKEPKEGERPFL